MVDENGERGGLPGIFETGREILGRAQSAAANFTKEKGREIRKVIHGTERIEMTLEPELQRMLLLGLQLYAESCLMTGDALTPESRKKILTIQEELNSMGDTQGPESVEVCQDEVSQEIEETENPDRDSGAGCT